MSYHHTSGHAHFRKTLLALAAGAALVPPGVWALDLTQSPPGTQQSYVAPNVIISVDDSGSMQGTVLNQNDTSGMGCTSPASGSCWPNNAARINILKYALQQVFSNSTLLPDGKIRLAWQAMWNNPSDRPSDAFIAGNAGSPPPTSTVAGASPGVGGNKAIGLNQGSSSCGWWIDQNNNGRLDPGESIPGCGDTIYYFSHSGANSVYSGAGAPAFGVNTMQPLQGQHRTDFLSFVSHLQPMQGTPAYWMFSQADAYMRAPLSVNGPWASVPGKTAEPYLGCRRNYHIMMTDGRWNMAYQSPPVVDNGNPATTLGDGITAYAATNAQTRLYRDSDPDGGTLNVGTLADWAFYSWATSLKTSGLTFGSSGQVDPSPDYTSAPATETFGATALNKFWNPKYDPATWPHMVTFTIGFSNDAVQWDSSANITAPTTQVPFGYDGSFPDLVSGAKTWPAMRGPDNETVPGHSLDLWHAAINGRGGFYAVTQPQDLQAAFTQIIKTINTANQPSLSTGAVSGFNASRADVGNYIAGYDPDKAWKGYVQSKVIKNDGTSADNPAWGNGTTTAGLLDAANSPDARVILTWNDQWSGGGSSSAGYGGGIPFLFGSLSNTEKTLMKTDPASGAVDTSPSADTTGKGPLRVAYLRGDRTHEVPNDVFRARQSAQGDIVNSVIWYTGTPVSSYPFKGYTAFVNTYKDRAPIIYVGGNDGMLHGFGTADGKEKIAYVPRGVLPTITRLTDPNYSHQYFVDGSPMTGDVDLNMNGLSDAALGATGYTPDWRTMLVGTLGAGGKGYFVLDVTNPANFTQANASTLVRLDRSMGNTEAPNCSAPGISSGEQLICNQNKDIGNITATPVIDDNNGLRTTQIALMNNNRWAVVLGNGYNSANQRPVLLIQYLDGDQKLLTIPTTMEAPGTGNAKDNGLSAPRLMDLNGDGRPDIAYAGDNLGNMWKFDLTSNLDSDWTVAIKAPTGTASGDPLFTARGPATLNGTRNLVQPISAAPIVRANDRSMDLASGGATPVRGMMVAFGTGRNVANGNPAASVPPDSANTAVQTLYSVLDNTLYSQRGTGSPPVTALGARVRVAPPSGTCPGIDCVPTPKFLGTGVTEAKLAQQTITPTDGDAYGTVDATTPLTNSTWAGYNGWYADLPDTGERLLQPMQFYDGSNILAVYTKIPAKGVDTSGAVPPVESCDSTTATDDVQYLTLINIMDGARPTVQLIDVNGDGEYDERDGGKSRKKLTRGPHTLTRRTTSIAQCAPGDTACQKAHCPPSNPTCTPPPKQGCILTDTSPTATVDLACMPEQSMRPSWRQLQ